MPLDPKIKDENESSRGISAAEQRKMDVANHYNRVIHGIFPSSFVDELAVSLLEKEPELDSSDLDTIQTLVSDAKNFISKKEFIKAKMVLGPHLYELIQLQRQYIAEKPKEWFENLLMLMLYEKAHEYIIDCLKKNIPIKLSDLEKELSQETEAFFEKIKSLLPQDDTDTLLTILKEFSTLKIKQLSDELKKSFAQHNLAKDKLANGLYNLYRKQINYERKESNLVLKQIQEEKATFKRQAKKAGLDDKRIQEIMDCHIGEIDPMILDESQGLINQVTNLTTPVNKPSKTISRKNEKTALLAKSIDMQTYSSNQNELTSAEQKLFDNLLESLIRHHFVDTRLFAYHTNSIKLVQLYLNQLLPANPSQKKLLADAKNTCEWQLSNDTISSLYRFFQLPGTRAAITDQLNKNAIAFSKASDNTDHSAIIANSISRAYLPQKTPTKTLQSPEINNNPVLLFARPSMLTAPKAEIQSSPELR